VDCDLRAHDAAVRDRSLHALCRAFEELGMSGSVTWFLNENDFAVTRAHASFLERILESGAGVGIHDHFDKFKRPLAAEHLLAYCRASRDAVTGFMSRKAATRRFLPHRNGCLAQDPEIYRALRQAGYTVFSDVYPGYRGLDQAGHEACDYRSLPEGLRPYRHDEASALDYRTRIAIAPGRVMKPFMGSMLQIPVFHMSLDLDFARLERWIGGAEATEFSEPHGPGRSPVVLTWLFHPYEVLDEGRSALSDKRIGELKRHIATLRDWNVSFVNVEDCVEAFRGLLYEDEWQ
jgi:hypothetical protein